MARGAGAAGLVLLTPTGLGSTQTRPSGRLDAALYALGRHTLVGDLVNAALASRPSITAFLKGPGYGDPRKVTSEVVTAYARSARRPNAKHAALAFLASRLALRLDPSEVGRVPTLVLWGAAEGFTDTGEAEAWR